jgi:hypothetical protein
VIQRLQSILTRSRPRRRLRVKGHPSPSPRERVALCAHFTPHWPGLRQIAGVFLGALLLLPVLAPIAAYADNYAQPTCCCKGVCHCRYCRKHHRGVQPADNKPAFDSPGQHCPCCPNQLPTQRSIQYALTDAQASCAAIVTCPAGIWQTPARRRYTCIRLRQKRGPPNLSFAA